MDALVNFGYSTVATAPSPATSGTTLTVQTGDGAKFPAAPFDVTLYALGTQPLIGNAEIARCTAVSTDTLTLTRAQYGTTAQSVAVGWAVDNAVTANLLSQIIALTTAETTRAEAAEATKLPLAGGTMAGPIVGFEDKGGQVFNVKAYGATGNGTTDDTAAIQAAINAAGAGVVLIPVGVYKISSTLLISTACAVVGSESYGLNSGAVLAPTDLSFDAIHITTFYGGLVKNLEISPSAITGGSGGQSGKRAIFIDASVTGTQNITLENIVMNRVYNGVYITGGGMTLKNCQVGPADITDTGRYGFLVTGATGNANSTQMFNCGVSQLGQTNHSTVDAFVFADGYSSLLLHNCGANTVNRALWSTKNGGISAPNFLQTYNFSSDHSNIGIQLDDGYSALFVGLMLISCANSTVNIASSYEGGPVQFDSPYLSSNNGGFVLNGASNSVVVTIDNAFVAVSGAGSVAGHAVEANGPIFVNVSNGQFNSVAADALHFDTSFTGIFMGSNLNLISNFDALHFAAGAGGLFVGSNVYLTAGQYGLAIESGVTTTVQQQNGLIGYTGAFSYNILSSTLGSGSKISLPGMTPILSLPGPGLGALTVPAVGTSGTAVANPFPFDVTVFVNGGTVSAISIGGVSTGETVSGGSYHIPAGSAITLTYSVAPTWVWMGD